MAAQGEARVIHMRGEPETAAARFARQLLPDVPAIAEELLKLILAGDDGYAVLDDDGVVELQRAIEQNISWILEDVVEGRPARVDHIADTGRRRAAQGVPLASVLHAFRLGFTVVWEKMLERGLADDPAGVPGLLDAASTLWRFVDSYSDAVAASYSEALDDMVRRDEQQRAALLDGLLDGHHPRLRFVTDAARALALPEVGPYVVVVADVGPGGADGIPGVEALLRRHGLASAWRHRVGEAVGVVALGHAGEPALRAAIVSAAVARVGISPAYDDLSDTAAAVALASLARSTLRPGRPGVVRLDDRPLATMIVAAPDVSARVARAVLGPVLALPASERVLLLEAFEMWVAVGGSGADAAMRLGCHRNTVRNRLARLEELTGRSIADPRSVAELVTAADAVRTLAL